MAGTLPPTPIPCRRVHDLAAKTCQVRIVRKASAKGGLLGIGKPHTRMQSHCLHECKVIAYWGTRSMVLAVLNPIRPVSPPTVPALVPRSFPRVIPTERSDDGRSLMCGPHQTRFPSIRPHPRTPPRAHMGAECFSAAQVPVRLLIRGRTLRTGRIGNVRQGMVGYGEAQDLRRAACVRTSEHGVMWHDRSGAREERIASGGTN